MPAATVTGGQMTTARALMASSRWALCWRLDMIRLMVPGGAPTASARSAARLFVSGFLSKIPPMPVGGGIVGMTVGTAAVFVVGVMLAGCGSSPGDGTSSGTFGASGGVPGTMAAPAGADQPGLESAVRVYSEAYLGGQGSKAYDLLSQRCQARLGPAEMSVLTDAAQAQYGNQTISSLTVDTLVGTLARVSYTYPDPAINQSTEPWVFEGGAWHQDDC